MILKFIKITSLKILRIGTCLSFFLAFNLEANTCKDKENCQVEASPEINTAIAMLVKMARDNEKFINMNDANHFNAFIDQQNPRATVVMCVDSRAHVHAFDEAPDNNVFKIANLSGQYDSSSGSIKYGILYTKTPLLMVIGHDDCGAVKARTNLKQTVFDEDIKEALKGVEVLDQTSMSEKDFQDKKKKKAFKEMVHRNTLYNIHRQVDKCLGATGGKEEGNVSFRKLVENGKLIIVGAIYDIEDRGKQGHGKLRLINVWDAERARLSKGSSFIEGQAPTDRKVRKLREETKENPSLYLEEGVIEDAVSRLKKKINEARTL
ncbi:MAG: carbonic anhydrase [Proteobacteria bacterium]|nr:carbonic anhydrase [Pseudomonadota bacterium]